LQENLQFLRQQMSAGFQYPIAIVCLSFGRAAKTTTIRAVSMARVTPQ
jgi:hypothetical protein